MIRAGQKLLSTSSSRVKIGRSIVQGNIFATSQLRSQPSVRCLSLLNGTSPIQGANALPTEPQTKKGHQEQQMQSVLLHGEVLDLAADLREFRVGDRLDIPYELTVSESMQDFWQSVRAKCLVLIRQARKNDRNIILTGHLFNNFIALFTKPGVPRTRPNQHIYSFLPQNGIAGSGVTI